MKEEKAKAEILICEKKLSDIREIQISNEVRYKKIKEKIIPLVNKLPRLSAKAALKEIPISQADQAKHRPADQRHQGKCGAQPPHQRSNVDNQPQLQRPEHDPPFRFHAGPPHAFA